jgi:hypothetical protein
MKIKVEKFTFIDEYESQVTIYASDNKKNNKNSFRNLTINVIVYGEYLTVTEIIQRAKKEAIDFLKKVFVELSLEK